MEPKDIERLMNGGLTDEELNEEPMDLDLLLDLCNAKHEEDLMNEKYELVEMAKRIMGVYHG